LRALVKQDCTSTRHSYRPPAPPWSAINGLFNGDC
jgi:hypothetical protein